MIRTSKFLLTLCLLFAPATTALALYTEFKTEEFGPAPHNDAPNKWDRPSDLRYVPGRRYWSHTGWNGWGQAHDESSVACQGDVETLNRALAEFAKIPVADKQIRLFPAPGTVRSFKDKVAVPCDWQIQWTSHTSYPRGARKTTTKESSAVMTVYIARAGDVPPLDPRAAEWIEQLGDARFVVRQRAYQALAEQREAALPLLQAKVNDAATIEQRMRLEQLIARLDAIHLARVRLPRDVAVTSLDRLMEVEKKNWASGDYGRSWQAACNMCAWAEYTDESLPFLVQILLDDRDQARDLALAAFGRLGKRAASVVPALHAAQRQAPATRREIVRQALKAIVQATDHNDVDEVWRRNRELRQSIAEYCRAANPTRS